tara:strand:+ start:2284 stop:2469 length:186 start_codon:yes stop_codon:yes gene_type:complete
MIVTFTVETPMLHDAREQAIRLAEAQGFSRVVVLSVNQIPGRVNWDLVSIWEVKLQLFRSM